MLKTLCARFKQGYRTMPFPVKEESLPQRFLGRPNIAPQVVAEDYAECQAVCPVGAIAGSAAAPSLDLGKCLFCGECQRACPGRVVTFTRNYRLAERKRESLVLPFSSSQPEKAVLLRIKNIFGRSLKLRQVSAGGCNACEADTNVLSTLSFDLARFGIQFVASPRHADGILVTGPVTDNMRLALEKTYQAVPPPKLVIAVGACAISGGPFLGHEEVKNGVDSVIPVDLYVPGCPPHPLTILDGLLKIMGQERFDGKQGM